MKALLHTLLCTLVVLAAGWATQSCTHNGGDVSPWWGTWHVESVEAQGKPVTTIAGDFFFQFQGEVVRLSWRNDRYDSAESYGNWSEGQGTCQAWARPPLSPSSTRATSASCSRQWPRARATATRSRKWYSFAFFAPKS